jgi:hypothetical protein
MNAERVVRARHTGLHHVVIDLVRVLDPPVEAGRDLAAAARVCSGGARRSDHRVRCNE